MTRAYINAIGAYVPAGRVDNYERGKRFGVDARFIDEKIGTSKLALKDPDEETSDLACRAIEKLQDFGLVLSDVQGLILCTQTPDGYGLPHTSARVHGKLDLPSTCAAFDISLGCSGYVYGLSVVDALMQVRKLDNVVFVTSDPYSKIVSPENKDTALLFGDAATATWMRLSDEPLEKLRVTSAVFGTVGAGGDNLMVGADHILSMNGREVFNFSAKEVPTQINQLLSDLELTHEDIDVFLLHQGSKYIVDTIAKRLGLPPGKVPLGITGYGNTVSSSIPMMLQNLLESTPPKRVILSGFGVGLSFATLLLERG